MLILLVHQKVTHSLYIDKCLHKTLSLAFRFRIVLGPSWIFLWSQSYEVHAFLWSATSFSLLETVEEGNFRFLIKSDVRKTFERIRTSLFGVQNGWNVEFVKRESRDVPVFGANFFWWCSLPSYIKICGEAPFSPYFHAMTTDFFRNPIFWLSKWLKNSNATSPTM